MLILHTPAVHPLHPSHSLRPLLATLVYWVQVRLLPGVTASWGSELSGRSGWLPSGTDEYQRSARALKWKEKSKIKKIKLKLFSSLIYTKITWLMCNVGPLPDLRPFVLVFSRPQHGGVSPWQLKREWGASAAATASVNKCPLTGIIGQPEERCREGGDGTERWRQDIEKLNSVHVNFLGRVCFSFSCPLSSLLAVRLLYGSIT